MKYLLFKSEFRLDSRVVLFDVGHGDCLLSLDKHDRGLLVDCGSWRPHSHVEVPLTIENLLNKNNDCGFIISHYHFDHYSLFHWLTHPDLLFSKIYVPFLPIRGPGTLAAKAVRHFLYAAILVDYSYYRILPEIFGRAKRPIITCKRGDYIKAANQTLKVLWPDISNAILDTSETQQAAGQILSSITSLLPDLGVRIPGFEEVSTTSFFKYLEDVRRKELPNEQKGIIQHLLSELEGAFRKLANLFSIVANSYRKRYDRFLFLGDVNDSILDYITIPGKRDYAFIKAAHHGTTFGSSLKDMSTEFVLLSRSKKEFPTIRKIHDGYICDLNYNTILSTDFLGHCLIL
jgi:hypothetical protein